MKVFWGDLHNHCSITYGKGSLENALDVARRHLDFVSVTPHAFWPDMPARNPDTDFIVDFHEKGFEKIAQNWDDVKARLDAANKPGAFTTLFSYEMHSAAWGDHHFLSPDRSLAIARRSSPSEVAAQSQARVIAILHHIGYTPGYRGINWDGFDESLSPVVEVVSKHGCASHEHAGFPYYHDMGPLDPRNTAFSGLAQGRRFGFVGSSDHHAGFPGSFGDGKAAVLATENTREAIFEALRERRAYAVTGSRILCGFTVNGKPMGSEIPPSGEYEVAWEAEASSAIDRILLYQGLAPCSVADGWALPETGGRYKVRLELGWGDNLEQPYPWEVQACVDGGRFLGHEQCVRGRSVLSPNQRMSGGDDCNRPAFSLDESSDQEAWFWCETYRNNSTLSPATAALVSHVEGGPDTLLRYRINARVMEKRIGELLQCGLSGQMKEYSSQAYKIHTAVPQSKYFAKGVVRLKDNGAGHFHLEVRQRDGDAAYVSPVFVRRS